MKILIAVPTFENIYPDTFKSIYDLDKCGHECIFEFIRGYDCATARNRIAQRAIQLGTDYVFMVDNDITLPKDALKLLLEDAKDVCFGYYAHRGSDNRYDGRSTVFKLGEFNYPKESLFTMQEMKDFTAKGEHKVKIHGGGMGCALVNTSLFDHLKYPWFDWVNYNDSQRSQLSEDLFFCERCRKGNVPIWVDTRVACGHMFRYIQQPIAE